MEVITVKLIGIEIAEIRKWCITQIKPKVLMKEVKSIEMFIREKIK
jgi:hypothetical protein